MYKNKRYDIIWLAYNHSTYIIYIYIYLYNFNLESLNLYISTILRASIWTNTLQMTPYTMLPADHPIPELDRITRNLSSTWCWLRIQPRNEQLGKQHASRLLYIPKLVVQLTWISRCSAYLHLSGPNMKSLHFGKPTINLWLSCLLTNNVPQI